MPTPQNPTLWPAVGRAAFVLLCVAVALVSLRGLALPVAQAMAHMQHHVAQMPLAAFGHMILGPLALILLPVQASARLRARRPALHRWVGRVAVLSMALGGLSALALLPGFLGSRWAAAGFAALGLLWIAFPVLGVRAARRRDVAGHRAFMLRAAALTFGAVTLRLTMAPLMALGWSVTDTYDVTAWACWVPNLLLVELWLARGRARKNQRAPAGAP